MSPSKMRRTTWYNDGRTAYHMDQVHNPFASDPPYYDRRQAWDLGWKEAREEAEEIQKLSEWPSPAYLIKELVVALEAENPLAYPFLLETAHKYLGDQC